MHLCRGNYKGHWMASGGYEPVAEKVFGGAGVDLLFLEFDSERSGDFAPLRHVPADTTVVLGLVSSKTPVLEPRDDLLRRIDEASKVVPVERLALSPQCGFASTIGGNQLTEDDERRKLALIVEVCEAVWGEHEQGYWGHGDHRARRRAGAAVRGFRGEQPDATVDRSWRPDATCTQPACDAAAVALGGVLPIAERAGQLVPWVAEESVARSCTRTSG